jgi:hypothetical protein
LIEEHVGEDYIVRTQRPNFTSEAAWQNEAERPGYIQTNKLRFLRPYQLKAIHSLQAAVGDGKARFLFEMATGTGKTLTAAAVIKLFLRSGNVRRVLFLVDRLELEDQAKKSFAAVLSADYQTVIYKENGTTGDAPNCRHHRAILASTTSSRSFLADRLRSRHLRRSTPLDRRQRPRRVRLLHRLQARPYCDTARLPAPLRQRQAGHPRPARGRTSPVARHLPHLGCEAGTHLPLLRSTESRTASWWPAVVDARTEITTLCYREGL